MVVACLRNSSQRELLSSSSLRLAHGLRSLSKEVFNADRGLWLATSQQELYPNPMSMATERTRPTRLE